MILNQKIKSLYGLKWNPFTTRKRKVPIKFLLMNQTIVVGVGNIYASEALFRAKVRPTEKMTLKQREHLKRLRKAARSRTGRKRS